MYGVEPMAYWNGSAGRPDGDAEVRAFTSPGTPEWYARSRRLFTHGTAPLTSNTTATGPYSKSL
jgi:hypothetical protein